MSLTYQQSEELETQFYNIASEILLRKSEDSKDCGYVYHDLTKVLYQAYSDMFVNFQRERS